MRLSLLAAAGLLACAQAGYAWDYEIHRIVNQLALASLPADFPAFVKESEAAERIAFLSGEPDRWRNTRDLSLRHVNGPDHYIDFEDLDRYGLRDRDVAQLRYDFIGQLAVLRSRKPDLFAEVDPESNQDHTKELVGLLPWAINEYYSKLKSQFSYLRAYEQGGGAAEEIANARENIVYVMGVMGHFVADATQPLHTTVHYNGWVGDNPHSYTTNRDFHAWIDGGYFAKIGIPKFSELERSLRPARPVRIGEAPAEPEQMFKAIWQYIRDQHRLVEPLYRLEKEGGVTGEGESGLKGRAMLEAQWVEAGQMLADIWMSAWQQAPPDEYLLKKLGERKNAETAP